MSQNHVFRAFEYQIEAQEQVLENPKNLMFARAGEPPLERKIRAPSIFCRHDVRSSGEVHARAGSYVVRPSTRAPNSTLEHKFDITSTFAGLMGPLERGPLF